MKIGYSKTYPLTNTGCFEKIWLEDSIETTDMEEVRQAQYRLKKQVESFHYESNKAAEKQQEQKKEEEVKIGLTVEDIMSCKELKVLENTYKYLVKNKPTLQEAYNQRFLELSK